MKENLLIKLLKILKIIEIKDKSLEELEFEVFQERINISKKDFI